MSSRPLTSTVATLLVLRSYMGTDELELELDVNDQDSAREKNKIEISCARDRLLTDIFTEIGKCAKEGEVILRGSGLSHLFQLNFLAPSAECRVAIVRGRMGNSIERDLDLTLVVDNSGSISVIGDGYDADQMGCLIDQVKIAASQLEIAGPAATVQKISLVSDQDMALLRKWNGAQLEVNNQCLHDAVLDIARMYPTKTAIATRQQNFNFQDIDDKSAILARHLIDRGFTKGATIPICFEKSALVPIIMMAIMRAGAAFIPLDSNNPDTRLRTILVESEAKIVITSTTQAERFTTFGIDVEVVDDEFFTRNADVDNTCQLATVSPDDLAYIIYTSGSTGRPKGVMIHHSAVLTAAHAWTKRAELSSSTRMLQFLSYAFDASIAEIFFPMIRGGMVCIPMEDDRLNDIGRFIYDLKCNSAIITPSFARTIPQKYLSQFQCLSLGGEVVLREDITERFASIPKLLTSYGPTEAAIMSSVSVHNDRSTAISGDIGYAVGCRSWVVDPEDTNRLMPIGGVGELLIEGHISGKGYWKNEKRTQASFIASPNFLKEKPSSLAQCYRTGDLVRLAPDGRTHFIQRKDDQIKIRGHRVDLGDITVALRQSFPTTADCATLLVQDDNTNTQHLVAVVCSETHDSNSRCLKALPEKIRRQLQQTIPRYMIPSLVLEVDRMPLTVSDKLDTKYLTSQVKSLLELTGVEVKASTTTWTPQEKLLFELWTQLGIPVQNKNQNLFSIGADSLKAIQLLHDLRENGMSLTAIEIFSNPSIYAMARLLKIIDRDDDVPIPEPFSFFSRDGAIVSNIRKAISDLEIIEDVMPCSPVQIGLMTASLQHDNVYVNQMSYKPCISIDVISLNRVWDRVVDELPILRTRIFSTDSGFVQVVMARQDKTCQVYEYPATYHSEIGRKRSPMKLGDQLFEVSIIAKGQNVAEMWITAHHVISDAWMMKQVLSTLWSKYTQQPGTIYIPFSSFIRQLQMRDQEVSRNFWKSRLEGATVPSYPEDRSPLHYRPHTTAVRSIPMTTTPFKRSEYTMATLAEAAWAILLQKYSNSDDITFGLTVNGRVTDMSAVDINGPTLATIPSRIQLQGSNEKVNDFLYRIQNNTINALPHAQFGVQNISQVSPDAANACSFRSLLVVQAEPVNSSPQHELFKHIPGSTRVSMDYPIVLEVDLSPDSYELRASFDETIFTTTAVDRLLQQLKHLLTQLQEAHPESRLADIDVVSPYDLAIIHKWNEEIALPTEDCIHESFSEQARVNANKQAIVSWDGQLTYWELEEKSAQLANVLIQLGIGKGSLVPLCFEKSMWAIVAMLAVMKAGAGFVSLDPSHPIDRLSFIIEQTEAKVVLGDASKIGRVDGLVERQITVNDGWFDDHRTVPTFMSPKPNVSPDDIAFLLFTSGSTGRPKGIVITHCNFCSSMKGHGPVLGIKPDSRVLQFCAYTCDVSMGEVWTSLTTGATVCVPSESQRMNDLAATIRKMKVTWTFQTPTVASHLNPDEVGNLQTLVYGSETASPENIQNWAGRLCLVNSYGPAETCIWATAIPGVPVTHPGSNIGYGLRCGLWVTEPGCREKLVPVGTIGELIVEGPNVASGYFKDAAKTAAAFFENPPWAPQINQYPRRCYNTGDLVRCNEDGSIEFLGRKDTQVKIRGLRVELGEIEYQIRRSLRQDTHIAVEMVKAAQGAATSALAAFICIDKGFHQQAEGNMIVESKTAQASFKSSLPALRADLEANLPHHMVPTAFVPLYRMPLSATGKTDRKKLREMIAGLSADDFAAFSVTEMVFRAPKTEIQRTLQAIWCSILKLSSNSVGLDSHWFRCGGDSVLSMKFVLLARREGVIISVSDIFQNPELERLAAVASKKDDTNNQKRFVSPFSLLPQGSSKKLVQEICEQYGFESSVVTDLYPCTPFQEGLMALSMRNSSSYVANFVFEIPQAVDLTRFRNAWEKVAEQNPILRSRFVNTSQGIMQAVLDEPIRWSEHTERSVEFHIKKESKKSGAPGSQLICFAIVHVGSRIYFVWTTHHALYDGVSMPRLLASAEATYQGGVSLSAVPFNIFVDYLQKQDREASRTFWRSQLKESQPSTFFLPNGPEEPNPSQEIQRIFSIGKRQGADITTATVLRAAWALLVGSYSNNTDVIFASTVSGRTCPLPEIDLINGPTVATVPVRVKYNPNDEVADYLRAVQQQASEMAPYEHDGLQNIREWCPENSASLAIQNLFVVQLQSPWRDSTKRLQLQPITPDMSGFFTYATNIECTLSATGVEVAAHFDHSIISEKQMGTLLNQFNHITQQLLSAPDSLRLKDLTMISPEDLQTLSEWNQDLTPPCSWTLHDVVLQTAAKYPYNRAVEATDGNLTYSDLESSSRALAQHLMDQGLGPKNRVLICYDKSLLAILAVLAVLRIGGAVVAINPQHPESRLRNLVEQSDAKFAVCTGKYTELCSKLVSKVVVCDDSRTLSGHSEMHLPQVSSTDEAFIYFTSGSSGVPKGVVLEHGQLGTSLIGQTREWGVTSQSRILQFSSLAYDAFVAEAWASFLTGACLCMPSDKDRMNNLTDACKALNITTAILTPTVVRSLNLREIPTLDRLMVTGEPLTRGDIENWCEHVYLYGVYGITEASLGSSQTNALRRTDPHNTLGKPYSGVFWVVESDNTERLAPIGAVGELIIESPSIARGYLHAPKDGASPFIKCPSWLEKMFPGRSRRVYKSGDLVRYTSDNTLEYIGRKDTVVKVNGQRVDVADIQDSCKRELPADISVAIEIVPFSKDTNVLAAFLAPKRIDSLQCEVVSNTAESSRLTRAGIEMAERLQQKLPRHSIPTVFIPVVHLPRLLSGKLDRQQLKKLAQTISQEEIVLFQRGATKIRHPESAASKALANIWADLLRCDVSSLSLDDHFFRMGGDSVKAMRLVGQMHKQGYDLAVETIFRYPTLQQMSKMAKLIKEPTNGNENRKQNDLEFARKLAFYMVTASQQCQCEFTDIEDIYPVTPVQEGLMAASVDGSGAYIVSFAWKIPLHITLEKLQKALVASIEESKIWRTRLFLTDDGMMQCVLSHADAIQIVRPNQQSFDLETYLQESRQIPMGLGNQLVRFEIVDSGASHYLTMVAHHSVYDGWMAPQMFANVELAYEDMPLLPSTSFRNFVDYVQSVDKEESVNYWKSALDGASIPDFPEYPHTEYQPCTTDRLSYSIEPKSVPRGITMASVIRAAWAFLLGKHTDTQDVAFGVTMTGRAAPVRDIETVSGPCINTVPARVKFDLSQTLSSYLEDVQGEAMDATIYEQFGLQNLRKISDDCAACCDMRTVLVVQTGDVKVGQHLGLEEAFEDKIQVHRNAINLQCILEDSSVIFDVNFDAQIIDKEQMMRILRQLEHVINQFGSHPPSTSLSDISVVSSSDLSEIQRWNSYVPPERRVLMHKLIEERVTATPDKLAIDAWDGSFTYAEYDSVATRLARYLVEDWNVQPDEIIPLYFEKSKWTAVAMYGILKSGAAYAFIGLQEPPKRIQSMLQTTGARLAMSSATNCKKLKYYIDNVVALSATLMDKLPKNYAPVENNVTPENVAYVLFTSGTTGEPKAVLTEHRAGSTSAIEHGTVECVEPQSRVLQFASYTFDVSTSETLTTLIRGGTVCIPSEADRLERLAEVINEMKINHCFLTPTVVSLISPEQVPNLHLLKLGGEALTRDNVAVWAGKVKLSNSYGVAECAIRSVFRQDITPETDFTNCGSAVGCCVWIANPQNYEELTPIGGVGELLIEGPTVARCYLGDPEKTNRAFVKPSWLRRLFPERKCRVYRTGDLVKYATDGTIRFVGRSDSQVKIHGQRCELREIEHHLCVAPGVGLAATVLATKGPYQGRLVAVVAFQDTLTQSSELTLYTNKSRSWLSQKLAELQEILVERVPAYMVPTIWIPVTSLPINPSGKMNRISIGRWLGSLRSDDEQFIRSLSSEEALDSSQPLVQLSNTEKRLQMIWSRVLNYPSEQISSGTSFFRIGGDSISSMQVAALCRAEQLPMTMQDIMQHRTLHRLAACCDSRQASNKDMGVEYKEEYDTPFPLGPIQSMFFDLLPEGTNEYDQGFSLQIREEIPVEKIANAIAFVAQRHPMLRARFMKDGGQWSQMITNKSSTVHEFESYKLPAGSDLATIIRSTRQKLDFKNGPVFVSAYADLGQGSRVLFLTAHHLVVDLVSWRVILRDIEDHIRGIEPVALTSIPFQTWLEQQRLHSIAHSEIFEETKVLTGVSTFWGLTAEQNVSQDAIEESFTISKDATTFIFNQASLESRIDAVDLLLGALAYSFSMVFHDRPTIAIDFEGHGREPWDPSLDLSDTVGWFATRSPLVINRQIQGNLVESIRAMRQLRRSAPENGRRFFAARYYCNSKHRYDLSEMSFNYIGKYQQFEASDSLFENLGASSTRDPSMPRFALIEMDAAVQGEQLSFTYEYPKTINHQNRIKEWLSLFSQVMETLSETLQANPPEPTLSDFPHLKISQGDFEKLIRTSLPLAGIPSARSVEDVYSCSPTQQGIFLSQLRDPSRYNIVAYFQVVPNSQDEPISIHRLEDAWKLVVARHQILRTVVLDTMEEHQSLLQIVLTQVPVKTARLMAATQSDAYRALGSAPLLVDVQEQPLHALTMCAVEEDGAAVCRFEISHALIDAASNSVLISDLEKAYSGLLVPGVSNPAFSSYIVEIQAKSKEESLEYWKDSLSGQTPCIFPGTTDGLSTEKVAVEIAVPFNDHAALREYCTRHDVTTATIYQLAWSIVLRTFTSKESTCFGFLASGRDMDIPDIQDSIGPYINMLVCAEDFKPSIAIHDALQSLQEKTIQSLLNQFTSLSEICHALGIHDGRLFNTVLSVQRGLTNITSEQSKCTVTGMDMEDPTEFDITVNVVDTPTNHLVALTVQRATISEKFAQRLAHTLSQVLDDIVHGPSERPISSIQTLSSEDSSQILFWNEKEPTAVNTCVHQLVAEQIKTHPTSVAVSAWDGDFTYAELDTLTAKHASKLVNLGVRAETFVPFCMGKTRWSVVAILSIMRAGGACVPLDPAYPRQRLEAIINQLQPPVILTSPTHIETVSKLSSEILAVGDGFIPSINDTHILDGVDVAPYNAVYVIFTSGTTGVPKGVVWNHSTLSSSALAHGEALKYNERSRMLQFAAHVFDISVSEIITTLIFGKCIVIPSDETRISGIEQFITERQVDWAFLTPTMARLIEADQVPTLKTLVLGGESIGQDNVEKWSEKLQMMIIWGPCETCIYSATREVKGPEEPAENFGFAVGAKHWIVDPADTNRLMPIGAVGELITEGPIVARGYYKNPEATKYSFIGPQSWSLATGSKSVRYYKTGDLGRYNDDGSISFVARKDNQVKVRGQRMELQDVEHNLYRMSQVGHNVVALAASGVFAKQLVAVLTLNTVESESQELRTLSIIQPTPTIKRVVREIQDELSRRLPVYMVPTVWVLVDDLPRTINGKIDRVLIKRWINNASEDIAKNVSQYLQAEFADRPGTETEKKIQQIWGDILNIPRENISKNSAFLRIGGDSITAMSVLSKCRQLDIFLSIQDILRSKSLSELASLAKSNPKPIVAMEAQLYVPFELSPIQKMHLNRTVDGTERFNQSFYLKLRRPVSYNVLDRALRRVVKQHAALRTRFKKTSKGVWTQSTFADGKNTCILIEKQFKNQQVCESIMSNLQGQINPINGPLLAVALLDNLQENSTQYLFITAHHLVVDLVSWRIILEDLEELLDHGEMSSHQSTEWQTWLSLHRQHIASAKITSTKMSSSDHVSSDFTYWGLTHGDNFYRDATEETFSLSRTQTDALLNQCHGALRTEPVDLMLTTVLFAFSQTFPDRALPTIYNEGHGREPWNSSIDLTRTVGWFTSMFPIAVPSDTPMDMIQLLRRVKDSRAAFTGSKGLDYFSQLVQLNGESGESFCPEVIFNYSGVYQQLEKEDSLFTGTGVVDMDEASLDLKRFSLFNFEMTVRNGELHSTLVYHRGIKQANKMNILLDYCKEGLENLTTKLPYHQPLLSLSDFSSSDSHYDDLDYLVSHTLPLLQVPDVTNVEDYVACSPMQNYMLNVENRIPGFVNTSFIFELIPGSGNGVDVRRLLQAWQTVVDRNPILRTIFVLSRQGKRMQLVLRDFKAPTQKITQDALERVKNTSPVPYPDHQVHQKLYYVEELGGRCICYLDISHNLSDAASRPALFAELANAYDECLPSTRPRSYISSYLEMEALQDSSLDFWEKYVFDMAPCLVQTTFDADQPTFAHGEFIIPMPSHDEVKKRCVEAGVTSGNLLHAAWAILLSTMTNNSNVCFNYLSAARDSRISNVASVIGPVFTNLLAKMRILENQSLEQVLQDAGQDFLDTLPHHGLAIAALERRGYGTLDEICNTAINFRKFVNDEQTDDDSTKSGRTKIESLGGSGQLGHALALDVEEQDDGLRILFCYRLCQVRPERAQKLARNLELILHELVLKPSQSVAELVKLLNSEA